MICEFPKIGGDCWAVALNQYPLPTGLANRSRVRILEEGPDDFLVEDALHRQWTLSLGQLDAGRFYELGGELFFETHPNAVRYLRQALLEMETDIQTDTGDTWAWIERKERIRWYLERNGFDLGGPISPGNRIAPETRQFVNPAPNERLKVDFPTPLLKVRADAHRQHSSVSDSGKCSGTVGLKRQPAS